MGRLGQIGKVYGGERYSGYWGLLEGSCELCCRIHLPDGLSHHENFQLAGSPKAWFLEMEAELPSDAKQVPSHSADPQHRPLKRFRPV